MTPSPSPAISPARNCSNSLPRTGISAITVAECRSESIGPRTTARSTRSFNRTGGNVFGLWQLTVLVESYLRRDALAWALQVALHCGARVSVRGDDSVARPQAKSVEAGAGGGGSRPVSWNHAATDGRLRGDLHHHGAHPEVPGREQAADPGDSGQSEPGKAERVCHVSSEAAAESDVPCSHRRCTTPSEPEFSSGPGRAAHASIAAVYSTAATATADDDEPTKLSSTVHATKPTGVAGCITAVAAVVSQPARRGRTGKLGDARDEQLDGREREPIGRKHGRVREGGGVTGWECNELEHEERRSTGGAFDTGTCEGGEWGGRRGGGGFLPEELGMSRAGW